MPINTRNIHGPGDCASPDELDCDGAIELRCLSCGWTSASDSDVAVPCEGDMCPRCSSLTVSADDLTGDAVRLANELDDSTKTIEAIESELADAREYQEKCRAALRTSMKQAAAARKAAWRLAI